MTENTSAPARARWARFRFGVIAPLLTAPPEPGELGAAIAALAARAWPHPTTGEATRFSAKTIERWFYIARDAPQPIEALARKVPRHAGTHPSISLAAAEEIRTLRRQHPRWSYQLVHDNLVAIGHQKPELGVLPGYATVCRYMKHHGLGKHRKPRRHEKDPGFVPRERRSFEVAHVHALWHCDFHDAKRKVRTASGEWTVATLFGVLDDRSRICCHAQWYLGDENTESFVHGLCQAFQKRGLPRALLSDNGAPMIAAETVEGLERLSIEQHTTLAETPEQNGKQEVFWAQVEGRLMAMLEGEPALTSSSSTAPLRPGSSRSTTAAFIARSSRRHSSAGLPAPPSADPVPRAMSSAEPFARSSRAYSERATAPSRLPAFDTSCRPRTARSCAPPFASHAGISRASTSSTRDEAPTSPRSTPSTRSATPTVAVAPCPTQPRALS